MLQRGFQLCLTVRHPLRWRDGCGHPLVDFLLGRRIVWPELLNLKVMSRVMLRVKFGLRLRLTVALALATASALASAVALA